MNKLTSQELIELSSLFAPIADASHNGIVIINRDGVILIYNRAAERMLGPEDKSPVGLHFSEIRPETWPD
ncbi:MAG: PAS domain-containing protein, partial [Lentisphaerae bacterium]|nr:PAS domain-containing protein [Lentisphaerota bacterium]